ncbi:hypothetical protein VTJ83DRAFT_6495 [Remersonia thermophila]|uniref:HECT-type E3 ubiquitin transferase n=1 Tax=Remersonia thermophila TaxID=72144 RepID=A0ABR4D5S0_9PEZI
MAPTPAANSGARYRSASRVEEIDVWDTMQGHQLQGEGDSSSSDEGIHPRRRQKSRSRSRSRLRSRSRSRSQSQYQHQQHQQQQQAHQQQQQQRLQPPRSRHARSLSHPFLFFGRGKKKAGAAGAGGDGDDDDDDDDDYGIPRGGASGSGSGSKSSGALAPPPGPMRGHVRGHSTAGVRSTSSHRDFATGRCMTCASLVRWPKDLPVFRCSICLTINDLARAPAAGTHRRTGSGMVVPEVAVTSDDAPPQQPPELKERPISLGHTGLLVDQCLRSFLASALRRSSPGKGAVPGPGARAPPSLHPRPGHDGTPAPANPASLLPLRANKPLDLEPRCFPGSSPGPSRHQGHRRRAPSWAGASATSSPASLLDGRPPAPAPAPAPASAPPPPTRPPPPSPAEAAKRIFRPLEDYITASVTSFACLNRSFLVPRSHPASGPSGRPRSRRPSENVAAPRREVRSASTSQPVPDLDPKLLLLGDVAENGTWWTGHNPDAGLPPQSGRTLHPGRSLDGSGGGGGGSPSMVSSRSPHIDWAEMDAWYAAVLEPARRWRAIYEGMVAQDPALALSPAELRDVEAQILVGQERVHRALLKASEAILKRPGRRLLEPQELRFLLILAANPLLHAWYTPYAGAFPPATGGSAGGGSSSQSGAGPSSGRYSVIIKRIAGLLSNVSSLCQDHLVGWLARYPETAFVRTKELFSGFLTYRLVRQNEKKYQAEIDLIGGLVPSFGPSSTTAALHAALGSGGGASGGSRSGPGTTQRARKQQEKKNKVVYREDWQIRAAAKVLGLLFHANNMTHVRRGPSNEGDGNTNNNNNNTSSRRWHNLTQRAPSCGLVRAPGQVLATSDFYMTLLDDSDLVVDFDVWESRRQQAKQHSHHHHQQQLHQQQQQQQQQQLQQLQQQNEQQQGPFTFCQYPFLLSMGAKMRILQHEARRQMETRARDAFFDSILSNRLAQQVFLLSVRRDCLVEDSLRAVSEAVGAGGGDLKKALRVRFLGEEGLDAGGLRKEWFLLLVREVFSPEHGLFLYDEDSRYCYFNPNALEPSEQFFLVGVVLGLALYNSIMLDVALPPFAFRKLLAAAPAFSSCYSSSSPATATAPSPSYAPTLDDLAEYRPSVAHGLRQLLTYDGDDFEDTFGLVFSIDTNRYGAVETVPLCPGGATRAVTRDNRREYVDAYVRYLLGTSVARQFEPFKRGFYTVVDSSDALPLFRPEEIELLLRGSGGVGEKLDVEVLKGVAIYEGWGSGKNPAAASAAAAAAAAAARRESERRANSTAAMPASNNRRSNPPDTGTDSDAGSDADASPAQRQPEAQDDAEREPTVRWFWDAWRRAAPQDQRRLLAFITGSDRVPAAGEAALSIRVACLGDECGRFPTARTCFNSIGLWRARVPPRNSQDNDDDDDDDDEDERRREARARFEQVLWRAVRESEGFGLR